VGLLRQHFTAPIPEGAALVTHKGKPHARFKGDDGKTVLAPLTKQGDRIRLPSAKWYGQYTDANGKVQRLPLCENKEAAEQMLADLKRKARQERAGITDPYEAHRKRPLAEHLADWEASLLAGGATAKHVNQTLACVRRLIEGCAFVFIADLSASRVAAYLHDLRKSRRALAPPDPAKEWYTRADLAALLRVSGPAIPALVRRHRLQAEGRGKRRRYPRETAEALWERRTQGRSIKTSNLYLDAVKAFASWLVDDRRAADNALAHLAGGNVKMDRRHDRQTLSEGQLAAILAVAAASAKTFRGLSGRDRRFIYLAAMTTGFRAEEVASLTPESFDLDATPAVVTLPVRVTKNRKGATQPIPPDAAAAFRGYLAGREPGKPLWPGTWSEDAAEMLRLDLEAAGVAYVIEGRDGPLFADFHSLRHSYIALLDKSGATLKEAMQLARHSDPKLTMAVYGKAQLHDLGEAVARLPPLASSDTTGREEATLQATGTDAAGVPYTFLTQTGDSGCGRLRGVDGEGADTTASGADPEAPALQGLEGGCERVRADESSSPTRTRTWNKPVNRRVDHPTRKVPKPRRLLGFYPIWGYLQAQAAACENLRENPVLPGRIR
jgi:integrase